MANDTINTIAGIFFRKYLKEVIETVPSFGIIQAKLPVKDAERIGESFVVPVLLAIEHGVTYSRSQNGAFALNASVDGEITQAIINSSQHVTRSTISYQAAAAATGDKDTSADSAVRRVVKNNQIRTRKSIEIDFLYGQTGLATVVALNPAGSPANTIQITATEWSGAIWSGMKNALLAILNAALTTKRTGTPGNNNNYTIVSVNTSQKWITLDATGFGNIVATDVLFFGGSASDQVIAGPTHNVCVGLHKQLTTTTGTLFGLNVGNNDVLQGNVIDAAAQRISFDMVQAGIAATMDHGNDGPKMVLLVNPLNWSRLNSDVAANRRYDTSYRGGAKGEEGVEQIFYHSPIGVLEIISHPFVKQGYAYGFSWDELHRPGETDLTYQRAVGPGMDRLDPAGVYFKDLENFAGYELRAYHSSAIYHPVPSHAFVIQNINPA